MKLSVILMLLLAAAAYAQTGTDKRLTGLEKRVTKVEQRVTSVEKRVGRLEGGGAPAADAREQKEPDRPVGVVFLRKVQQVGQSKVGIRLCIWNSRTSPAAVCTPSTARWFSATRKAL